MMDENRLSEAISEGMNGVIIHANSYKREGDKTYFTGWLHDKNNQPIAPVKGTATGFHFTKLPPKKGRPTGDLKYVAAALLRAYLDITEPKISPYHKITKLLGYTPRAAIYAVKKGRAKLDKSDLLNQHGKLFILQGRLDDDPATVGAVCFIDERGVSRDGNLATLSAEGYILALGNPPKTQAEYGFITGDKLTVIREIDPNATPPLIKKRE